MTPAHPRGRDPRIQGGRESRRAQGCIALAHVGWLGNCSKHDRQSLPSGLPRGENAVGEGHSSKPFCSLETRESCPGEVTVELSVRGRARGGQQKECTLRN